MYGPGFWGSKRWSPLGPGFIKTSALPPEKFSMLYIIIVTGIKKIKPVLKNFVQVFYAGKCKICRSPGRGVFPGAKFSRVKNPGRIQGDPEWLDENRSEFSFPASGMRGFFSHAGEICFLKYLHTEWMRFLILP